MNISLGAQLAQKVQSRQQSHMLCLIPALILREAIKGQDKEGMDSISRSFFNNYQQSKKPEPQPK